MFLFWILFGALVGVSAAHRRGFGIASGVLGGMLLGPFAVLMFFASSGRKRCTACAEWMNKKAIVCPHCRTSVHPTPG